MLIKGLTESIACRLREGFPSISPVLPCCRFEHSFKESMRNRTKYKDLSDYQSVVSDTNGWLYQNKTSKITNPPPLQVAFRRTTDALWFLERLSSFCHEDQICSTPAKKEDYFQNLEHEFWYMTAQLGGSTSFRGQLLCSPIADLGLTKVYRLVCI